MYPSPASLSFHLHPIETLYSPSWISGFVAPIGDFRRCAIQCLHVQNTPRVVMYHCTATPRLVHVPTHNCSICMRAHICGHMLVRAHLPTHTPACTCAVACGRIRARPAHLQQTRTSCGFHFYILAPQPLPCGHRALCFVLRRFQPPEPRLQIDKRIFLSNTEMCQ